MKESIISIGKVSTMFGIVSPRIYDPRNFEPYRLPNILVGFRPFVVFRDINLFGCQPSEVIYLSGIPCQYLDF